jgi:transcriptional regulator of acetoin/glycerol metabolism
MVREGRFREDLYYRLNGALFTLPPLRERQDLDWLIDRLLADATRPAAPPRLTPDARAALHRHGWPGNLRELHNAIDYARTVCNDGVVRLDDLPDALTVGRRETAAPASTEATPGEEAERLLQALRAARWNVSAVARTLGCSRMTLYRRMKRFGIASPLDDSGPLPH